MPISRRHLLFASAAGLLRSQHPGQRAKGRDEADQLSPRRQTRNAGEGFVDEITLAEDFFVRCHTYTPQIKLEDWKLTIDGLVEIR